ncbi:hypothetical protein GCM10022631_10800 [Deinococcus rubellus]|uniref:DUF7352 domain-containing protein n=1 Tax=Deinococcus rubellus TaxID=1889240 RepID=UPI0031F0C757
MNTIQKYELTRGAPKTICLALMAVPVRVAVQNSHLCMWVREPADALTRKPRVFITVPTGETFAREYTYIGICEDDKHPWHVLEITAGPTWDDGPPPRLLALGYEELLRHRKPEVGVKQVSRAPWNVLAWIFCRGSR